MKWAGLVCGALALVVAGVLAVCQSLRGSANWLERSKQSPTIKIQDVSVFTENKYFWQSVNSVLGASNDKGDNL